MRWKGITKLGRGLFASFLSRCEEDSCCRQSGTATSQGSAAMYYNMCIYIYTQVYIYIIGCMNHYPLQCRQLFRFCFIRHVCTRQDDIRSILSSIIDGSYLCWLLLLSDVNGHRFLVGTVTGDASNFLNFCICILSACRPPLSLPTCRSPSQCDIAVLCINVTVRGEAHVCSSVPVVVSKFAFEILL